MKSNDRGGRCQQDREPSLCYNLGINEYRFNENGVDTIVEENKGFYVDETWTVFGVGAYPTAGGSIRVGFDVIQFFEDLNEIFD